VNNKLALQRRTFLGTFCGAVLGTTLGTIAASALPHFVFAQNALLPLNTPGLDHLDVIVPDVAATAKFYMGVFNTALHAQPFQGGQRYFVLLGPLPENRAVGYLAIGDSRGRGTYIGHFCTSVVEWRRDSKAIFAAMAEGFSKAGLGEFPGSTGVGGIFADPDGIEIQFLPAPDTVVTAAVPSDLVPAGQGLVTPLRVDNVLLQVSDIERALVYYRILYGNETQRDEASRAVFEFSNGSRLLLEPTSYVYGNAQPHIARFGIRVKPFDRTAVADGITKLGATVLDADDTDVLRFRDPDGNVVELVAD
jgi:catechol 2,3-dioxygenase-like lactoylglutathione lyase family enzyme